MLGVIHRTARCKGHASLRAFFFREDVPVGPWLLRSRLRRHAHPIHDACLTEGQNFIRHSALGLARIYNLLPHNIVSTPSVAGFQAQLQALLRAASHHRGDWPDLFSPRIPAYRHPLREIPPLP